VVSGRVRQSALVMRRKSTCLRMTSSGSAAVSAPAACDGRRAGSRDKALAPMCQVNFAAIAAIPPRGVSLAGPSRGSARRRHRTAGAGSRTRSRQGTSHGAAGGTTSKSCFHCRAPRSSRAPRNKCRGGGAGGCGGCGLTQRPVEVGAGQAAFARRILRRRSADRSSSFSPPQVPYFSGRLTA